MVEDIGSGQSAIESEFPLLHPRTTMRFGQHYSAFDNSDVIVRLKKKGLVVSRRKMEPLRK